MVGAFRKSLIGTDEFSLVWLIEAGDCISGDATGVNIRTTLIIMFIGSPGTLHAAVNGWFIILA